MKNVNDNSTDGADTCEASSKPGEYASESEAEETRRHLLTLRFPRLGVGSTEEAGSNAGARPNASASPAAGNPTDEEIAAWADSFIRKQAFNRPAAVQIATEAAKWVRSRGVTLPDGAKR